ncbi:MAG: hypothetical protein PHE89_03335 [Alphaproteobacteria bacterium]|nr:hypothetical protein [Alphaproteobacteria bacterium]
MSSGLRTKIKLNKVFYQVINHFKKENVSVVMPTYVPQRGEILKDFAKEGIDTFIAGGQGDARCFSAIPQKGLDEDTSPYLAIFPKEITRKIVDLIPEEKLKNRKTAVFAYIPDLNWSGHIKERNLNTEIVGSVEQDLRKYFEEKGNLITILKAANLENHTIPTREILPTTSLEEIKEIYREISNEQGKIVLQSCHASTGAGKGTLFINSLENLIETLKKDKGYYKATRFIKGSESNLSFFSGNTLSSRKGLGANKIFLDNLDANSPQTLFKLFEKAKKEGISDENIVTLVGRATLKSVGDENLTSSPANGVGNDIGYIFPDPIAEQIKEIGDKLSKTLAKAGRVGLAGADLIIDEQGKVWINEINDRQQGPTSQMSKDAEANELPSLMKVALVASFADFNDAATLDLFKDIQKSSNEIHETYAKSEGEFYLKINATHPKENPEKVTKNLKSGFYDVVKQKNGEWKLLFGSYRSVDSETDYQTDTSKDIVTIKIDGADLKVGDTITGGTQLFRLTGVTNSKTPPFVIEEGRTVLSSEWKKIVKASYEHVFHEGYMNKNPLVHKKLAQRFVFVPLPNILKQKNRG